MIDRILYLLLWLVIQVLGRIPAWLQELLAGVMVRLYGWVGPKEVAVLRQNVARIYGLPPGSHFAKMFETQVLRHQVLAALDVFTFFCNPQKITIEGLETVKEQFAADTQSGRIVCTAHIGSWEFCALVVAKISGRTFHVLAKPSRNKAVTQMLDQFRQKMGSKVLWTDRKSLLRDMLGALKSGDCLGFVMDQKPEGRKGPQVSFFDQPTAFVSGPASIALKTKAPIYTIYCFRRKAHTYQVKVVPISYDPGKDTEESLTQALAANIEANIRAYPEQWTWNYRRWKLTPTSTG